jgi:DNA-binding winged helix-turn-helix (wHTH) protein
MGFGLCNALAKLSRLMNHVLEHYINKFVLDYLDDICIYSETLEQHIEHLRLVLQKLREHELVLKIPK